MGTGIGKTLLAADWEISCWNRTAENDRELIDRGATYFSTPAEAVVEADYIITMLWNQEALQSVLVGEEGLFLASKPGQTYIDMSTQLPEMAEFQTRGYSDKQVNFLDAPVHGTKGEANNGGLWIMCGGQKDIYKQSLELFEIIGESIGVTVLLSNIVHEVNKIGENKGLGEENASAVVKVFEDFAGL